MVVYLEQGADLHMAQLMRLPITVSCFSKIQIGFTSLVLAHLGSPGKRAVKRVCVCVLLLLVRPRTLIPYLTSLVFCFLTVLPVFSGHLPLLTTYKSVTIISFSVLALYTQV